MKLEEAIEILKQNKEIMEMISPPDKQTESLMLAIQALEKQNQLEYIRFIVKNTYETPMCDSLAMQALRDHFKREVQE